MQKHRIWIPAVLLGLLITGCSQQAAGQPAAGSESSAMQTESFSSSEQYESPMAANPWEELNISEDFYRVTENFSRLFFALDSDGARYDQVLDAVNQYLSEEISQQQAVEILEQAVSEFEQTLNTLDVITIDSQLTENLRSCGISPEEYEAFANSRPNDLQSLQIRTSTLLDYLQIADVLEDSLENLRFMFEADAAEQDSLRGYYYYGCLNYWFTSAGETELDYLQQTVIDQLKAYIPDDPIWYSDTALVEERTMLYLDDLEKVVDLTAAHVGEQQTDLYQEEQNYQALLELIEQTRLLQQMTSLNQRLETIRSEIAAASDTGDQQRLDELKIQLEEIVAEYEALKQQIE